MNTCKYCMQQPYNCPCAKVDRFFNDNWHLLYTTNESGINKYRFAVITEKSESLKLVDYYYNRSGAV